MDLDELMPGNRVTHKITGRKATVLEIAIRWRVPSARIKFDSGGHGVDWWVPSEALQRIDENE